MTRSVLTWPWSTVTSLFDRRFDPARARKLPVLNEAGQSNVRGLYMAGEIAGTPLIKLGLNRGRAVIDHIVQDDLNINSASGSGGAPTSDGESWEPADKREGPWFDVLIIGAGSAGLGAADRCQELGLSYVVIESQRPAQLIRNFTKGKPLFMEPQSEQNQTRLYCHECAKEKLLKQWDRQIVELGLGKHIREFETVRDIQRLGDKDGFRVTTDKSQHLARRVVLSIGKSGNPRKLNVPGELEHAARISQNVADPDEWREQDLLITVQWTLAFLIPNVLMWIIHGLWPNNAVLGNRDNWWHASGFEYAFPLFFWQFFWDVGWLYLIYGLVASFVVIPLLTIRHGKRYCTWFCGCGGLAETLGDPWRHLAPKGKVSQRWEWMNMAVLVWAIATGVLVAGKVGFGYWITGRHFVAPNAADHGVVTAALFDGYRIIADIWLVGIIPVALYPIYGGKIWCRYWCPLAKWMQMTSKWFGTLQISSDDQCITCGECSRHCEVGIDVMSFAKNQQSFSNENTSCIHCGICVTVCPMDVLSFNNDRTGTVTRRLAGHRQGVALTVEGSPSGV